jgi:hypothetical protein
MPDSVTNKRKQFKYNALKNVRINTNCLVQQPCGIIRTCEGAVAFCKQST